MEYPHLRPCTSWSFGRIEWIGCATMALGIRDMFYAPRIDPRLSRITPMVRDAPRARRLLCGRSTLYASCVVTLNLACLPAAMQERLLSARHPSARRPWRPSCSNAIGPTDFNWHGAHHICIFPSHPVDITNPPEREKRTVLTCLSYCRRLRRGHLVVRAMESAAKCLIAIGK